MNSNELLADFSYDKRAIMCSLTVRKVSTIGPASASENDGVACIAVTYAARLLIMVLKSLPTVGEQNFNMSRCTLFERQVPLT